MRITNVALFTGVLALAACSGGSSGFSPAPAPSNKPAANFAKASVNILIPARDPALAARSPKYLTPAVQGIEFIVSRQSAPNNTVGYVFYALTAQQSYCTSASSGLICTLDLDAPAGADVITVNTYDRPAFETPSGQFANQISTAAIVATIAANQSNTLKFVTSGIVNAVALSLDNPVPPSGTALTQPLRITAVDADDYVIVGNYANSVALSDSDTTGVTALSTASLADSAAAAAVTLTYNGSSMATQANITTNAGGFVPFWAGAADVVPSPSQLVFAHANSAKQTVTLSGPHSTPPYTLTDATCNGAVTISGTSPSFTVTPVRAANCQLKLSDSSVPADVQYMPVTVSP